MNLIKLEMLVGGIILLIGAAIVRGVEVGALAGYFLGLLFALLMSCAISIVGRIYARRAAKRWNETYAKSHEAFKSAIEKLKEDGTLTK